ncbi:C-X-C motif chemokine 5-like [Sebastes umbrosus]|uniref:C-X-C motif chemokine 5-like n=1 Tax=Sebastes umbrosus TaxID=72105 RepID=UPI00189D2B55|nr:C-X-C motif chemokine 5-like [Sebastes umbrosus]
MRGEEQEYKTACVAKGLRVNVQLVSSMKLYPQSVCQFAFLSLCCVLITVRESDSTFVPGRCLCPQTQPGVRGQLKELSVYPKSPSCDKVTVIVTLKSNNEPVCLDPGAPMGRQLTRCWNRAHRLGRDVTLCLKRRRRGGRGRGRGGQRHRSRQRSPGHNRKASSSNSQ